VNPTALEIQIGGASEWVPRRFGRRIKRAGGRYTNMRGTWKSKRFVTIPLSERSLVWEVLAATKAPVITVVFRGGPQAPAWVDVQNIDGKANTNGISRLAAAEAAYKERLAEAERRGIVRGKEGVR